MTVFEFFPRFHNEDDWSCASVDKESPWCLAISDCLWHHEARFYDYEKIYRTCEWLLTPYEFASKGYSYWKKDYKTYKEYIENCNNPEVVYDGYEDCGYYGLKNTDGTLDFAYQNDEYVFIVHIESGCYLDNTSTPEGFGCVVSKLTNEIHCVALGEDDGNYWGDHDIEFNELTEFDWGVVSMIVNEMKSELFWNKEALVETIFNLAASKLKKNEKERFKTNSRNRKNLSLFR